MNRRDLRLKTWGVKTTKKLHLAFTEITEGVVSVVDANVGSILGIGAPTWTGGYIQFVNTYGLKRFIDRCDELAALYGECFKAPAIVAEILAAGENFQ